MPEGFCQPRNNTRNDNVIQKDMEMNLLVGEENGEMLFKPATNV